MVYQVNLHEVKSNLHKLLEQVKQGEEVVIIQAGQPVARLVPFAVARRRRSAGTMRDRIVVSETPQTPRS